MVQLRGDWFNQMDLIQQEMNRLLDHFAGSKPPQVRFSPLVWEPAINVYETEYNIVVIVELAGVKESDISITVDRNIFTIRGERHKPPEVRERRVYHRVEITSGPFQRSIELPAPVDTSNVKASYDNGLVVAILPKAKKRKIHKVNIIVT
jgi:HSP20 family protein